MGCPKDSVPIVPRRTGGMSQGLCPYGPMEDRWDVLRTLSLLSHGGQVGCPKDSVPMVPMEDRWDVLKTLSLLSHVPCS